MPRYASRNFATRLGRISTRAEWTAIMTLLKRGMPIYLIMKILEHNRVGGQGKWAVVRRALIASFISGYWWWRYGPLYQYLDLGSMGGDLGSTGGGGYHEPWMEGEPWMPSP
jgi:hypothetical protein